MSFIFLRTYYIFLLSILFLCHYNINSLRDIICQDPDVGSTIHNKDRKFLLIGSEGSEGAGIGNLLIFFPAAFWFAAFTGRNIVISDGSTIGEMCKIITCGFPMASELSLAFPKLLPKQAFDNVEDIKHADFFSYMEGKKDINSAIVRGWGYKSASDWWVYYNHTAHCVKKITGCDLGDIACSDRHAYQRLIRGPFKTNLTPLEEKRITGVPTHIKHAILTLPHTYAPRLDAAIHIRAQFTHFENQADSNDPAYKKEVADWLNSQEATDVFKYLEEKVVEQIIESRKQRKLKSTSRLLLNDVNNNSTNEENNNENVIEDQAIDPVYIYLASDNEEVKDAFIKMIELKSRSDFKINIMRIESKGIHHVKNLAKMKQLSDNEGVLDLVFDWYALTLANYVFAWRKGGTTMVSTFVHSAQRVSGNTERTKPNAPIGHGIGTGGYVLKNKHNSYSWDRMWSYTFLEDFQIPGGQ